MFNISEGIASLRDADSIASSTILTDAEKGHLLGAIRDTIPPALNRPYIITLSDALERLHGTFVPAEARPTEGKQDATPVASGPGSPAAEAPEGPTPWLTEQTEIPSVLANAGFSRGTPSQAATTAQGPKQGKARK